jgi:hypothetical protein
VRFTIPLLILVGCARSEPSERELLSAGQDATRTFFAQAEAGDCSQLSGMLQRPQACDGLVKQFRETHTHLSKILGAKIDGRDKHTVLVNVEASGEQQVFHWIVRATWTPEKWKFAL